MPTATLADTHRPHAQMLARYKPKPDREMSAVLGGCGEYGWVPRADDTRAAKPEQDWQIRIPTTPYWELATGHGAG
jgi:hypothetical protein